MQAAKTNFSALAVAIKNMGARNAALASARSQSDDAGTPVQPLGVDNILRDPPDSGTPVDETDRYCICPPAVHDACKVSAGPPYCTTGCAHDLLLAENVALNVHAHLEGSR
jgi:hypothetical protein